MNILSKMLASLKLKRDKYVEYNENIHELEDIKKDVKKSQPKTKFISRPAKRKPVKAKNPRTKHQNK